jgi:hypothetical protein
MERPNLLSALLTAATSVLWLGVVVASEKLVASEALLLVAGVAVLTLTAVAGLLFTQALWAQRLSFGLIGLTLVPVGLLERSPAWWIGAGLTIATAYVLASPTTAVRVGLSPSAPPRSAALLMLSLVSTPTLIALVNLGRTPPAAAFVVAAATVLLAWLFGKVSLPALWSLRTALPLSIVGLAFDGPFPISALLLANAAAIGWFAWQAETHIATVPLIPKRHHPKPVFAEFTPPEVLDSAGLDRKGRRA